MKMLNIARTLLVAAVLWVFFAAFANGVVKWSRPAITGAEVSWVSQEKLLSLARHHGTDALKITELEVSIWRSGNWVPVLKNKEI
ncbi:MAG: hypothetical protein HKM29_02770 [Deltaproteobacteria bacterium]|nr:hypothetical protein [Deltaproteobacteria bacterium]